MFADRGMECAEIGSPEGAATSLVIGADRFRELRNREIQKELADCGSNVKRIEHALHQTSGHSGVAPPSGDKHAILRRLHEQKRNLENQITQLHSERRQMALMREERMSGCVTVSGAIWPGSTISIADVRTTIDRKINSVRFQLATTGDMVEVKSLLETAA